MLINMIIGRTQGIIIGNFTIRRQIIKITMVVNNTNIELKYRFKVK